MSDTRVITNEMRRDSKIEKRHSFSCFEFVRSSRAMFRTEYITNIKVHLNMSSHECERRLLTSFVVVALFYVVDTFVWMFIFRLRKARERES